MGAALTLAAAPALAGPDWLEQGDAGPVLASAQFTLGVGQITSIEGSLSVGAGFSDLEDLFLVQILEPTTFTFEVNNANFNPTLYLFNVTLPGEAFGLLANRDRSALNVNPRLVQAATDGSFAQATLPGLYPIGICGAGRAPTSLGGSIFNFASDTEISGPDGPGNALPHTGWVGNGEVGGYIVRMTGVGFANVPGPGSAALILAAGVVLGSRRRRVIA